MERTSARWWFPSLCAGAWAATALALAFTVSGIGDAVTDETHHLMPILADAPDLFKLLALVSVPVLLALLIVYRRAFRGRYWLYPIAVIGHVLPLLGVLALTFHLRFFEPQLVGQRASPDGQRVAYLYTGGVFGCEYILYVRRAGSVLVVEQSRVAVECDDATEDVAPRWSADGRAVTARHADGRLVSPETSIGCLFCVH